MIEVFVDAIGLAAPGLPNWAAARAALAQGRCGNAQAEVPYTLKLLPQNERRRAPPAVKQAFRAAEDALSDSPREASELATVFASSDADLGVSHRINTALTQATRPVSPTDFHNSVHNAAAGYWGIAVGCRRPANSVAAYDASFAAGLLEAASMALVDAAPVLMIAFDVPAPPPLLRKRELGCAGSIALLLAPDPGARGAPRIRLGLGSGEETRIEDADLEHLRLGNPALRGLPLLILLAAATAGRAVLPYQQDRKLIVEFEPA